MCDVTERRNQRSPSRFARGSSARCASAPSGRNQPRTAHRSMRRKARGVRALVDRHHPQTQLAGAGPAPMRVATRGARRLAGRYAVARCTPRYGANRPRSASTGRVSPNAVVSTRGGEGRWCGQDPGGLAGRDGGSPGNECGPSAGAPASEARHSFTRASPAGVNPGSRRGRCDEHMWLATEHARPRQRFRTVRQGFRRTMNNGT